MNPGPNRIKIQFTVFASKLGSVIGMPYANNADVLIGRTIRQCPFFKGMHLRKRETGGGRIFKEIGDQVIGIITFA